MGRNLDYAERLMVIDGSGPDGLVLKWLYQLKGGAPFEEVKKAYLRDRKITLGICMEFESSFPEK